MDLELFSNIVVYYQYNEAPSLRKEKAQGYSLGRLSSMSFTYIMLRPMMNANFLLLCRPPH